MSGFGAGSPPSDIIYNEATRLDFPEHGCGY